ncbi:MAG TPA: 30S ribosomal protein S3 [Candidatus Limnocylindria bacterium]|nr:30S ribosomal protein S3 [Candidatus Limnocylindria bacterium]
MGQKTHPHGFRLGFTKTWNAKWYANKKNYRELLKEDVSIRNAIRSRLRDAAIARIDIERSTNQVTVTIHTAKPGVVIGKGGAKVEELRQVLGKTTGKAVKVNIFEIRFPEVDANLIAENVAQQLERRVSFRKVLKQTVQRAMKSGAKGVRVAVAGRLGGAEMSRREWEREGRVPLHTLRGDIDFGRAIAKTTYGTIGVKAWIYRGDIEPAPRQVAQSTQGIASRPAAPPAPPAVPAPPAPAPAAPAAGTGAV